MLTNVFFQEWLLTNSFLKKNRSLLFATLLKSSVIYMYVFEHCTVKNTVISPNFLVWKFFWKTEFHRPKLCENYAFQQNFHTRKLGQITVFFIVLMNIHLTGCDLTKTFNFQNYYFPEYHLMYHTGEESKSSIFKFFYKKYFWSTTSYYSSL